MSENKLNLFELEDEKDRSQGRIKATLTPGLRENIKNCINSLSEEKTLTAIAEQLGINYQKLWEYLNRKESIPLTILKRLEKISEYELKNHVEFLEYGAGSTKKKLKFVNSLKPKLAKIAGAHCADGNLRIRESSWKGSKAKHYEIIIREGSYSTIKACSEWFNEIFDLNLTPKRKKNHFLLYISNKIILRYFNKLLDLPLGKKTEKIEVPPLIKKSKTEIKKAFLQGVFMFDGSVNYRNGYVELMLKSKDFIEEVSEMLSEMNLQPDLVKLNPDKLGRYRLRIRKNEKLEKALILFERETEKWWRLKEHLHGLDGNAKNLKGLREKLERYYPKPRESSTSFSGVLKIIEKNDNKITADKLSKLLKRGNTVVYEYLKKLENWNILESEYQGSRKIWSLKNGNLPAPRR